MNTRVEISDKRTHNASKGRKTKEQLAKFLPLGMVFVVGLCWFSCKPRPAPEQSLCFNPPKDNKAQISVALQLQSRQGDLVAVLQWVNKTDHVVWLERSKVGMDHRLESNVFTLYADHRIVPYIKPMVKRLPPQDTDFVSLSPGEQIESEIPLAQAYDIPLGPRSYQIRYQALHMSRQGIPMKLSSAWFVWHHEQEAGAKNRYKTLYKQAVSPTYLATEGEPDKKEAILAGLNLQKFLIQGKMVALERWNVQDQATFLLWFGTTDENARRKIYNACEKILALNGQMTLGNFKIGTSRDFFAQVDDRFDTANHWITLFYEKFFHAQNDGFDSKPGILSHEMSHFVDIAETIDEVNGQVDAQRYARLNPQGALQNGDNFEYYLEDPA